jgi:hypothetical protein
MKLIVSVSVAALMVVGAAIITAYAQIGAPAWVGNLILGDFDANAFGYVGHTPFGGGCITGEWAHHMLDNIGRWDLSQLGGGMTMTWDQVEAFVTTTYPNHRVVSGSLVDDSCSFAPLSCGQAYYDLFTYENRRSNRTRTL